MPGRLDRLDIDALERIRETEIWKAFETQIRERLAAQRRTCCNGAVDLEKIRLAQGEAAALEFVLGLPDAIFKDIVKRRSDGS